MGFDGVQDRGCCATGQSSGGDGGIAFASGSAAVGHDPATTPALGLAVPAAGLWAAVAVRAWAWARGQHHHFHQHWDSRAAPDTARHPGSCAAASSGIRASAAAAGAVGS